MKNKTLVTGGVIAAIIIGVIFIVMLMQGGKEDNFNQTTPPNSEITKNETMDKTENPHDESKNPTIQQNKEDSMMKDESMQRFSTDAGSYKDFSSTTIATEANAGNKVVLFFHAPWCPFCKTADEAFRTRASEIPSGVTVLKTDYDSNTELKKKYGVTYQHSFVQVDSNGNLITKWNGGDIDNLKKYIK